MTAPSHISASLEDYIEAIFHIVAEKQAAKPRDLAGKLRVANSSVTGALRLLAGKGLINYAPYDIITLTPAGAAYARDVVRRHEVLRDFFVDVLAVGYKEADEAACGMEHAISKAIVERLVQFAEFVEVCPRGGEDWIAGFRRHCERSSAAGSCVSCVDVLSGALRGGHKSKAVKLNTVRQGWKCRVIKTASGGAGRRLREMGVTPGALLEVESAGASGGTVDVKVKGYHISLDGGESGGIYVETLCREQDRDDIRRPEGKRTLL